MKKFHEKHTNYLSIDRRTIAVCEAKGRKYSAINKERKKIAIYQTDDGMRDDIKQCDYAFYILEDDRVIFIELKGSNIEHAIKQIESTLQTYITNYSIEPHRIDARIVASRVRSPKYYSTSARRLKQKLSKYGKGTFEVATQTKIEEV